MLVGKVGGAAHSGAQNVSPSARTSPGLRQVAQRGEGLAGALVVCREWAWASHGSQRRRTQGGPSSAAACCQAGWGAPRKPRPARRSQEGGSLGSRAWLCSRIGGPPGLEQWEKDLGWASWGGSRPAPRSLWALCPGTSHVGSTGRPSPSRAAAPPCHLRVPVSSRGGSGAGLPALPLPLRHLRRFLHVLPHILGEGWPGHHCGGGWKVGA